MSYILDSLPKFRRIPTAETVQQSALLPNAVIVAEDTEQLFIDSNTKRINLSPVRPLTGREQLPDPAIGAAYVYICEDTGSLFVSDGKSWREFTSKKATAGTYMYRFEVAGDSPETIQFSRTLLQLEHCPEFDIIDTDGYNITNSDFISRRWIDDVYEVAYSGGWPPGEYYLKTVIVGN